MSDYREYLSKRPVLRSAEDDTSSRRKIVFGNPFKSIRSNEVSQQQVGVDEADDIQEKLVRWAQNRNLIVHRIIRELLNQGGSAQFDTFVADWRTHNNGDDPSGNIGSLCTNRGNAYGQVLKREGGQISILPELLDRIRELWNQQ